MNVRPINILLVEDNEDHVMLTVRALKENGLANRIDVVKNGEEALDYIYNRGEFLDKDKYPLPELMLLDIKLPKIDGLEILDIVKNDDDLKSLPVIMLTTSENEKDIIKAYSTGANSYITKPVSFNKFMEKLVDLNFYWVVTNTLPGHAGG